jgi:hypothetical protein
MPSHQHIPGFMAVGMFVAQNQGTGYIILENPNIAGDTIKDSTFVQVLTLSYEQKNRPGILLSQNFPNPFSRTTSIQFCLEKPIDITLTIHSIEGIRVRTLADGIFFIGTNSLTWDGKDKNGLQLPNGVYFYQLRTAEGQILTRKMILSD